MNKLVSNCCGASDIYDCNLDNNEGVCSDCGEHCEMGVSVVNYNKIATDIVAELKDHARRTDKEIAERLGISRQAYIRRRDSNRLTTEDITSLSAWLVTAFGGGFYLDKPHSIKRNEANQ